MKSIDRIKPSVARVKGRKSFSYLAIAKQLVKQGYDVINFGIGQPDLDTPKPIINEAKKALDEGFTKYTEAVGIAELREAIAEYLNKRYSTEVKPSEIIVTPGALPAIYLVYAGYVEPGDEVIIIEPSYPPYTELTLFCNAIPKYVPLTWKGTEKGFELDLDLLKQSITKKTKLIVLNNPHNPTGAIIPSKYVDEILEIAEKNNIVVLADEIYNELLLDSNPNFKSTLTFNNWRDVVAYVNGFSKTFSMTGWRLGYLVVREDVASKLANIAVNIWSCSTSFVQKAGIVALRSEECWNFVKHMIDLYKKRRDFIVSKLKNTKGIDVWPSSATLYLFPYIGNLLNEIGMDVELFVERLLYEKHVVVLPGTGFPDKAGASFIRLSFALDIDKIDKGVERIKEFIEELK
ncbi:MAG: pyridoxal phosphate-dependent aminotransferase [Ignisphaera sp.]|uniref:Aminotransferase n=1 Tax=Ignisphaera aggregans TaxID=334771 RepID=A0A7J3MZ70_9CREN